MSSGIRARTSSIHVPVAVIPLTPIQDLENGLIADGVFAKFDRLWIFAQATEALALVDLVAGATATAVNSPTFTANRGYTGQDAASPTSYINSNYNPTTNATNYVLNSAHMSVWHITGNTPTNGGCPTGLSIGASENSIFLPFTDASTYARINTSASNNLGVQTNTGHWIIDRTGASAEIAYRNGGSISSPNSASTSIANGNFYILARNNGTAADFGDPNQVAMISYGGGLTATDVTNFYNRLRTYMTAVGVP